MPQIREIFRREKEEKREIENKVESEDMRTTDIEASHVQTILKQISEKYRDEIAKASLEIPEELNVEIRKTVVALCSKLDNVEYESKKRIERLVMANIVGLGVITPYMQQEDVTDIIVQHYDNIVIERNGLIEKVNAAFMSEEHLINIINRIVQHVGRAINVQNPMVDARLPNGSRINATIPPVSPDGATLTIRKFSEKALTGKDYLRLGSLNQKMLYFLAKSVESGLNIICSGGTGAGKTTLLDMLSSYIPEKELIVTVEDSLELKLHQPNVRRMEARLSSSTGHGDRLNDVTIQDLVRNAMRMRPDRLIVGEIRDHTVIDMMSAMSTGHDGSMSTVHANSPHNLVVSRLPILYGMSRQMSFSEQAQAIQISEALQLIVQIQRLRTGKRAITHITEVTGIDREYNVILNDIFLYDEATDKHRATGYIPRKLLDKMKTKGIDISEEFFIEQDEEVTNNE